MVSTGIRVERNDYENKNLLSPRFNAKYNLKDGVSALIYNAGKYYQNPPEIYLSVEENSSLQSVNTFQHSLTYERLLTTSTKLYSGLLPETYSDAPMLSSQLPKTEPTFLLDRLAMYSGVVSTGSSQTNGVELLIEKKRV